MVVAFSSSERRATRGPPPDNLGPDGDVHRNSPGAVVGHGAFQPSGGREFRITLPRRNGCAGRRVDVVLRR